MGTRGLIIGGQGADVIANILSMLSFSLGRVLLRARRKVLLMGKASLRIGHLDIRGKRMSLSKAVSDISCSGVSRTGGRRRDF